MANTDVIEHFYGVYLLYCLNSKYLGRNYIGFTIDPNRRIKQHNKGKKFGGAWKTSSRGPWKMVLIVHGFPNDISALRFEWAWQHPQFSRRLKHIPTKKTREKSFDFHLRILSEMLNVGPWNRLPLTVDKKVPVHMPICYGPVISKKLPKTNELSQKCTNNIAEEVLNICFLCCKAIEVGKKLNCLSPICDMTSHIICLSKEFLANGEYIPLEGFCPKCKNKFLWGEIVRKYVGCYNQDDNNCYTSELDD